MEPQDSPPIAESRQVDDSSRKKQQDVPKAPESLPQEFSSSRGTEPSENIQGSEEQRITSEGPTEGPLSVAIQNSSETIVKATEEAAPQFRSLTLPDNSLLTGPNSPSSSVSPASFSQDFDDQPVGLPQGVTSDSDQLSGPFRPSSDYTKVKNQTSLSEPLRTSASLFGELPPELQPHAVEEGPQPQSISTSASLFEELPPELPPQIIEESPPRSEPVQSRRLFRLCKITTLHSGATSVRRTLPWRHKLF